MLFNIAGKAHMSDDYLQGVELSNSYIPLRTNLYDASSVMTLTDPEWVERFHYKYGFHRKALYIDTTVDAVTTYHVTGESGPTRVAVLNDLFQPEADVALYIDPNFYNINKLAEMRGYSYSNLQNTDEAGEDGSESWWDKLGDLFKLDIAQVTKTGGTRTYDRLIPPKIPPYGSDYESFKGLKREWHDAFLYTEKIQENLILDDYSPLMGFAVVSALYRHETTFNVINTEATANKPVFESSPNLAAMQNAEQSDWNTIYNYLLLKNLSANVGIDYQSQLDMNAPIYIDIYGNIITESGTVVIPAAANATLHKASEFEPHSVGFISLYQDELLPTGYNNEDLYAGKFFTKTEDGLHWKLKSYRTAQYDLNFDNLATSNKDVLLTLQNKYKTQLVNKGVLTAKEHMYLVTEVLRGAPIENIDKAFEGLEGNTDMSKTGLYMAYKLEDLASMLLPTNNGNSLITLPNLAFMEGVEYVIVFAFKILFAVLIVLLMYQIYVDAVSGSLGIRTMGKFLYIILVFVMCITAIPAFLNISYYESNKMVLKNEMEYIAFLNLDKNNSGKEIGIAEITEPKSTTQFYIKVDQVSVPWWEVLGDVLTSDTFATMGQVYEEAFESRPLASQTDKGIIKRSNGLYMSLDYLFNSSDVYFNTNSKALYQTVNVEEPVASYILPYYVFLDMLTRQVNRYNQRNQIYAFTTNIQSKGRVRTLGVVDAFFTSDTFMLTDSDLLGLYQIYGVDNPDLSALSDSFDAMEVEQMHNSLWWNRRGLTDEEVHEHVVTISDELKAFVVRNRDLMGKVTDETFLKMAALSMAMKHNELFKVNAASGLEMFDVDAKDVIRMSLAPKEKVMEYSAYSFSRFVYMIGGTSSVFTTALLIAIYFVSSLIKPVCMIIILVSMVLALIVRQFVQRNTGKALEGAIITMSLLMGTNVIYAGALKLSLMLPEWGCNPVISCIMQIFIQIGYFAIMAMLTVWVLKDWQNMGMNSYSTGFMRANQLVVNGFRSMGATFSDSAADAWHSARDASITGADLMAEMYQRDAEKEKNRLRGRYDGSSEEDQ
jgi:hypothetical protein